jgi:hypothetical protein
VPEKNENQESTRFADLAQMFTEFFSGKIYILLIDSFFSQKKNHCYFFDFIRFRVLVNFTKKSFNRINLTECHLTEKSVVRTPFNRKCISPKFFFRKVVRPKLLSTKNVF